MFSIYSDLFPTKCSLIVFLLYITLFECQGILVTASQSDENEYDYDIFIVVLMTEMFKLIMSIALYYKEFTIADLMKNIIKNRTVMFFYFVPAFLYCLYNNLSFLNLATFDPTTYCLLLQLRVVITAILFQIVFKKQLSKKQWLSLLLLTVGCMVKQLNFSTETEQQGDAKKFEALKFNISATLIVVQMLCSCLAGIYNEYLLKYTGASVNIFIHNIYMYVDSIICNVLVIVLSGNISKTFMKDNLLKIFQYKVLVIIITNATSGIITSFFLKTLNSILKTFASALQLILTAVWSYALFNIPIYWNTVVAILIVLCATYLYSQNPVSNASHMSDSCKEEERIEMSPLSEVSLL